MEVVKRKVDHKTGLAADKLKLATAITAVDNGHTVKSNHVQPEGKRVTSATN